MFIFESMKMHRKTSLLSALVLSCLLLSVRIDVALAASCLSAQATRQAISEGRAAHLSSIAGNVSGDVVSAKLCENNGRLVYQVVTLSSNGSATHLTLDARSGAVLGSSGG